jgi:hypothetical protein
VHEMQPWHEWSRGTASRGGGATIWPQTGARANEALDDSEDNDSSSDLGAKQENLIKRLTSSLRAIGAQSAYFKAETSGLVSPCSYYRTWSANTVTYLQPFVSIHT